jgi:hypothetical protein
VEAIAAILVLGVITFIAVLWVVARPKDDALPVDPFRERWGGSDGKVLHGDFDLKQRP